MNRYGRCLIVGLAVLAAFWLARAQGQEGQPADAWQPLLSKDAYKELVKREVEKIQQLLSAKPDEAALHRATFGAVLIMAYTKSLKEVAGEDTEATFATALELHDALQRKDGLEAAKKLVADLAAGKTKARAAIKTWNKLLEPVDLMDHFRTAAKGGDGMHPDLQNNIKFKGALNGIEEKIRYLALKELPANTLKKEAKELELLGYRTAVVGSLTYLFAPATKKGNRDPNDWRRFSLGMRDASLALSAAAAKGDATAMTRAANALNSSCSQCHGVFRN